MSTFCSPFKVLATLKLCYGGPTWWASYCLTLPDHCHLTGGSRLPSGEAGRV